ncbi:MAG: ferredoxin [Chloroflexi bacterium CG_4_9_14_3_um_filter_45_9]|nr:MAG: ferredoxin [Dehalococcoidia bacterium CG2_30_46_9]PIU22999.1 MAG: ferredoxin [Chloroflexi bacterium CG08_land_8_20_14_0_20_45_12]PIX27764.1 MAG: ferredoxin [Chloroflexi bacterium CG_4_8_14_3_um_filter_45_15]PJB51154.1 MAG: ferredoxin [Chloroflexi bacterium CG_4_9_14_3_um_filter_45_9]
MVDGKKITAPEGSKVLQAAEDNGIYIPNLCAIRQRSEPFAACRLCFVEVEGEDMPVTACTKPVTEGMRINTKGGKALRLACTAFELILASHPVDCAHCLKSGSCELQRIAKHLGVKLNTKRFPKVLPELPIDSSSPVFVYDPNKCVLCGRCIWVCQEKLAIGAIGFAYRGFQRRVTTFGDTPFAESDCQHCGECVNVCPVGALVLKLDSG